MDRRLTAVGGASRAAALTLVCAAVCGLAVCAGAFGELPDPTRPPSYPYGGLEGARPWDLTSTLIAPGRRVAVLNGRVVREGGRVDGMAVVKIGAGEVVLRGEGRRLVIPLVPQPVKRLVTKGAR